MGKDLAQHLIYLDAEFISRVYEQAFDVAAQTQISRTDNIHASASLAFFSGGGNSSETRTYGISPLAMLQKLDKVLAAFPSFEQTNFAMENPSVVCWVRGHLGTTTLEVTRSTHTVRIIGPPNPDADKPRKEFVGKETYFSINSSSCKFALSATDQYFSSGLAGLKGLTALVIDRLTLPCSALLRVISANTSGGDWVAVPLVIYDGHDC